MGLVEAPHRFDWNNLKTKTGRGTVKRQERKKSHLLLISSKSSILFRFEHVVREYNFEYHPLYLVIISIMKTFSRSTSFYCRASLTKTLRVGIRSIIDSRS